MISSEMRRWRVELLIHNYKLLIVILTILVVLIFAMSVKRVRTKDVVTLISVSALIAAARGFFFFTPHIKPSSALLVIVGSAFGFMPGLVIGALSSVLSNFIFGQGPWTIFQMIGWGLVGAMGSLCKTRKVGVVAVFFLVLCVYSPLVNIASAILMTNTLNMESFIMMTMSGFPLDMIHAVTSSIFIFYLWSPIHKRLGRLHDRYGVLKYGRGKSSCNL